MKKGNQIADTINQIIEDGIRRKVLHLYNSDKQLSGSTFSLKGKEVVNFGSCSYLGLEFDTRLKNGAKQAIDHFGTQFSESRAYVSLGLYKKLEELLEQLFNAHVVVTSTTTLGHISAIPVLVEDGDVVVMDHQVHTSVQTAVNLLKPRGIPVELLRHNRMDLLEARIIELRKTHRRIWYMADGIYSMYGDCCPVADVEKLLNTYPELHFYVDDAHGMSYFGKNGSGYVLSKMALHQRMVLATSLNKAFAAGGGVLVFPTRELAARVRNCGSTLITSGPMQPGALGAAIASAQIHLSSDIEKMQKGLRARIRFANMMLAKYKLPLVAQSEAAVFFVGVSLPKLGYGLVQRMIDRGFYLSLGIFPAVPMKNTGIRFTITLLHSFRQIEQMVAALAEEMQCAMQEENMTMTEIYKAFRLQPPAEKRVTESANQVITEILSLQTEKSSCITEINRQDWDALFAGRGSFDWEGLRFLQDSFRGNEKPEENWDFDYIMIRDNEGKPVLATFATTALWKDDMLSPAAVSAMIEEKRKDSPYFLTSKMVATGSLLTEGEHIFLNRESPYWREALKMMFEWLNELQENYKANGVMLRDFVEVNDELDSFFIDHGFFRIAMPDTHVVETRGTDRQAFYQSLSPRSRQHFRQDIAPNENRFTLRVETEFVEEELPYFYKLYNNVRTHSLALNTFALPYAAFCNMLKHKQWEVLTLRLNDENGGQVTNRPVAVMFCYRSGGNYIPMILGMDYECPKEFKLYKQVLFKVVERASLLGDTKLFFGFGASMEKRKMGAQVLPVYAYLSTRDVYNMQVLQSFSAATRVN